MRLAFLIGLLSLLHPVHVSLVSFDYDTEAKGFSVFMKLFSDDLEFDCRLMTGNQALSLYDEAFMPDALIISRYVNTRLIVEAGGEKLEALIENIEADSEEVRIALLIEYQGEDRNFKIVNTIMTDLYDDQANLLIFKFGDFEEGYYFTRDNIEITINIATVAY